ncbi:carbohydrate binding domain-containing protein [Streptomyces sp. NPDC056352]|uniref:carbohydrate binding domain-containing protein n=1 Tax=Streptomyces sp. NPDC056352 TaxID=3345791 RepID=UPI0035D8D94B
MSGPGGGTGTPVNGDVETGSLAPWSRENGGAVVSTPAYGGAHALAAAATASRTGECTQTLTLSPHATYTLSGWVQGNFGHLGVRRDATAGTWGSSSSWTKQSVSFTTGSTNAVTVRLHGWCAQGTVHGDDISVAS